LKDVGEDVSILTYHKDEFYAPFLDANGVRRVLLEDAQGALKRIVKVCRYIGKEKPDVVIAYQEVPSLIACLAKICNPKVKLIVSERNTTQEIDKIVRIRFFLYRWADAIVPNSYSQEKFIKRYCPKLMDKVTTITNFVDISKFCVPQDKKRSAKPIIMVAATIFNSKNTLGLIEALGRIPVSERNFIVKWYGYSERFEDYYNQCVQKIESCGVGDCIQLLPKTLNISECYQQADYFCLPSFFEGTPNVICEAISSGLPVLCSDVCDNAIYVHEGENGFLFNPNSSASIAEAIQRILLLDENQYMKFSLKSREIAEEKLAEDIFLSKYREVIDRL
jgi:glycosyltransferase involved in cell wall biosynthesis